MRELILTRDEIASLRAIDKKLLATIMVSDQHIQKFLKLGLMTQRDLEYFLTDAGRKILEQTRK
jgi:hypothetical protein